MQAGFTKIPALLLEHGADLEARDAKGETPLFDAVRAGRLAAVRWLLEHGANAAATNMRGQSLQSLAVRSKKAHADEILGELSKD